jgi:periplasmic protein TonB
MRDTNNRTNGICGIVYCTAVILLGLFCAVVSCSRPEETQIFKVGNDVTAPVVLEQPLPAYTEEARKARAEGIVVLQGIIRKNGSIDNLKVLKKLGYGLDESAMNTVASKWHFKPGTHNGVPVDVQADIEVSFKLY